MKFGQVTDPSLIDFSIPPSTSETIALLHQSKGKQPLEVYLGCPKWNKTELKGLYPRGTKDELTYYATLFNAIELNATFYNTPTKQQIETWRDKTPDHFKFFPKIPQSISHYRRLLNCEERVDAFIDATVLFEDKLGMAFLQLIENYKPKDFERLAHFLRTFPQGYPLAVEVRNEEWFKSDIASAYYALLQETQKTNIIVDTPGRRDMMHMRLTTPTAFVRFVSTNHPTDYTRLDDWAALIKEWKEAGLQQLYFFIHQNLQTGAPLLTAYFAEKLNNTIGTTLHIPHRAILPNPTPILSF